MTSNYWAARISTQHNRWTASNGAPKLQSNRCNADAIIQVVPFFFAIEQRTKGMCGHESKQIFRAVNKAALFSTSVYG